MVALLLGCTKDDMDCTKEGSTMLTLSAKIAHDFKANPLNPYVIAFVAESAQRQNSGARWCDQQEDEYALSRNRGGDELSSGELELESRAEDRL